MSESSPYQLMPPLTNEEYTSLKEDIRLRGVLVPLEFDESGNVLDGHHRKRIISELRIEGVRVDCQSIIRPGLTEREKRQHVRAINLQRRHLTQAQRRTLIAEQLRDTPDISDRQIAGRLGVSDKTVGAARRRLESIAEIPQCSERRCADGRKYPSVVAKNEKEAERALQALAGLNTDVLPNHPVHVRLLERIRRESDSSARAEDVENALSIVGNADIRLGDFREVLGDMPDGSADLILTDPAYAREYLPLWADLGKFAARVLRPSGILAAYTGQSYLPQVLAQLTAHLEYVWVIAQIGAARKTHNYHLNLYANWKPILIFAKPPFVPGKWFDDVIRGQGPEKSEHAWQQGEGEARRLVETFSHPGNLIIDPFCGSGTTPAACVGLGRRFVGCDIDGVAVATSRERVRLILQEARTNKEGAEDERGLSATSSLS